MLKPVNRMMGHARRCFEHLPGQFVTDDKGLGVFLIAGSKICMMFINNSNMLSKNILASTV